ncbi:MAG: hypothetical protein AB7P49_00070 [Bdellovibrionales bacterium]
MNGVVKISETLAGMQSRRPMALQNGMYLLLAVNALFWILCVGFFLTSIFLYFESGILAFGYTPFWIGTVLSTGIFACATIMKPAPGVLTRMAVVSAVGVAMSVLGIVGLATYLGVAVVPQWSCILDLDALSDIENLLCASDSHWVAFVLWFVNFPLGLMMLLNGGLLVADFIYLVSMQTISN